MIHGAAICRSLAKTPGSTMVSAIITGQLGATATFGATTLPNAGSQDVFVAKVDATGSWIWATHAGGTGNDVGYGVSALADATAIITGDLSGTATFGATTLTGAGGMNMFVAKISATGGLG